MPQQLPELKLTPEEEHHALEVAREFPSSNWADSLRLRDAIRDLNPAIEEVERLTKKVNLAIEKTERLDDVVRRLKWPAWGVLGATWVLVFLTAWTAVSNHRLAVAAEERDAGRAVVEPMPQTTASAEPGPATPAEPEPAPAQAGSGPQGHKGDSAE